LSSRKRVALSGIYLKLLLKVDPGQLADASFRDDSMRETKATIVVRFVVKLASPLSRGRADESYEA
jgi:hypothetical protein